MSFWMEDDIDTMLSATGGIDVVHGTESGKGLFDTVDEELLRGDNIALVGRMISVLVKTTAFPTLTKGASITIAGVAHTVRDRMAVEDGALTRLLCLKGA